jgi:abhydrolase domain-containing protein 6
MKKRILLVLAIVVALAVVLYFTLPGLMVKWAKESDRKAAGLQTKSVHVGDHEIAYLEGGHGEQVLMVHGFAANKDNWTHFAKFITPTYHVVALDLPGFGDSTCLESAAYGIVDQAKRLDQFANSIGCTKFHIVGNSMGGQIAAQYALLFPEKALTLGLFNSSGVKCPVLSELMTILAKGEPNPLIVDSVEGFDRLIKFVFFKPPAIPDFAKKLLVEEAAKHKASNERIAKQFSPEMGALEPDLPKIKARTLVLWGDKDRVLDLSCVQVFEKGLPNCTAVVMKDCGHLPMMERPQEAAEHYLTFLKSK